MLDFIDCAANVKPSKRQLDWFDTEAYAFIHFGVNTFTGREWGTGMEPESIFNPAKLDCSQWVDAIKSAGLKGMVLTCKHHDGFCLWPSKYTEHSIKNSPLAGRDLVQEAADACRKGGIKFGIYLSPWDRNSNLYGTPEYNDYFCSQLTELLTGYGEIFYVWFDNACGEGPGGKIQQYDFPRYVELIRKYQPDACIFNDFGPDVRWCGNEAGKGRYAEWSVVPSELCSLSEVQTGSGPMAAYGNLDFIYNTCQNLGTLDNILYSKGLTFTPSEIDTSIRPGWFWHENEEPHSLQKLFNIYLASVGSNAALNLNIPPNRDGLIDKRDVNRLKEFGALIDRELGHKKSASVKELTCCPETQPAYEITLEQSSDSINYVILREDISKGQRIESFQIEALAENGSKYPLYQGTTVGNRKICQLTDPFSGQNPLTRSIDSKVAKVIVKITSARGTVHMKEISVC